jgi:glucose/arabinose dehydrogenase
MRKLILASMALALVACAGGDDAATDTTAAAIEPATPALTPAQSMYAGTWNGRSYRLNAPASDTGSAWTMTFTPAGESLTGTLRFSGQTTDIPIRVEQASESGMRTAFGPYTSPTVRSAEVNTTTDGRIQGDSLFGSFVATPTGGGDRVSGRFVARRQ